MAKQEKARARGVLLVAALLLVTVIGGLLVAGSAGAQPAGGDPYTPTKSPKTSIHPSTTTTPPPPRTSTPPPTVLDRCIGCEDRVLPFTGADLTLFIVTGLALVATGVVLVRRTRARREAPEV
jgi:uncharacterized surface anchored protein